MDKFKVGDKVEVIKAYDNYKGGEVGTITSISGTYYRINGDEYGVLPYYLKKVGVSTKEEEHLYEDQWHLNDGKVEIPDDADKLEKDGSVVAFRKRKVKPFEFGDKVKHKSGGIYLIVGKDQPGLYRIIKEGQICSVTSFEGNLTAVDDKEKV